MKKLAHSRRSLGLELLERREVFSGNVVATIEGGNLIITGDDGNNNIVITRGAVGEVVVAGGTEGGALGTETQVNGVVTAAVLTGFTGDILIDMRAGNDRVLITDLATTGLVNAYLGTGNDTFLLQSRSVSSIPFTRNDAAAVTYGNVSVANSVVVYANAGNDTFGMYDAVIGGDLVYYGDFGDDAFVVDGTTTADAIVGRTIHIDMGWGDDTINISRLAVRDSMTVFDGGATVGSTVTLTSLDIDRSLRMYLSIGADNVVIRGDDNAANRLLTDDLVVFTGDTADNVTIENVGATNITLDTGAGDEGNGFFGIELRNLTVAQQLWVHSGDGFDNVLLENSTAGVVRLFTGAGSDGVIARNLDAVDAVFDSGELGDVLGLYDSNYERLVVGMYAGSDRLYIGNVRVTRGATFDGGEGDDFYLGQGGNDFAASNRVGIENVSGA